MNQIPGLDQIAKLLEQWRSAGLVDEEKARKILEHHSETAKSALSLGVVFSMLGSLLIGAGVITLIAYNYSEMGNMARTVVTMIPLAISLCLTFYLIRSNKTEDSVWAEGVSIFYLASIAAALSLISQTYHIQGNWQSILFQWVILGLPVK